MKLNNKSSCFTKIIVIISIFLNFSINLWGKTNLVNYPIWDNQEIQISHNGRPAIPLMTPSELSKTRTLTSFIRQYHCSVHFLLLCPLGQSHLLWHLQIGWHNVLLVIRCVLILHPFFSRGCRLLGMWRREVTIWP